MNTSGQIQLMKVEADNVTLNDVNLVLTTANKHTLDVYGSQNVQLNNVTLNHENAQSGAPLAETAPMSCKRKLLCCNRRQFLVRYELG